MIYAFEEIGPDLARPPLAARRALLGTGVAVPLDTWGSMPLPARQAIVQEGVKDAVSDFVVKNSISSVLKRVRFMGPVKDPPLDSIPQSVVEALRSIHPLTLGEWQGLRPLDRYTLVAISSNSRLLYRAIEEMTTGPGSTLSSIKLRPWVGLLAHAEVNMTRAGVRAARSAHEVLDGYAERYAGPVEIDARLDMATGGYVWQAHVSTAAGEFFAAASLLAAVTAAVALRDSIANQDPSASIANVALKEEAWSVGSGGFGDEATVAMSAKAYFTPGRQPNAPHDEAPSPARRGVPVWVAVLLVLSTLLAFAAAGMTIHKNGGLKRMVSSLSGPSD
jgi:hypothetical protein